MASIVYENLADDVTVSVSSSIASAPSSLLQNVHVTRRWKGRNGDTEHILTGLISNFDTIGLFGIAGVFDDTQAPLDLNAITRIRVSSVDATGVAGDVYDSGSAAGRIDSAYGQLTILRPALISGYARIDLSQASSEAILAGRLVIGAREDFSLNFGYGWSFGYSDLSRKRKSAGGQAYIERDDRFRVLNLSFDALVEADRYGFVHEIDRLNGVSRDVLFIIDENSSNLGRDCVWGLVTDLSPPTQPNISFFSKSYAIEERL